VRREDAPEDEVIFEIRERHTPCYRHCAREARARGLAKSNAVVVGTVPTSPIRLPRDTGPTGLVRAARSLRIADLHEAGFAPPVGIV